MIEFYMFMFAMMLTVFIGTTIIFGLALAFAIKMGWLPGVTFPVLKDALVELYKETFKK